MIFMLKFSFFLNLFSPQIILEIFILKLSMFLLSLQLDAKYLIFLTYQLDSHDFLKILVHF